MPRCSWHTYTQTSSLSVLFTTLSLLFCLLYMFILRSVFRSSLIFFVFLLFNITIEVGVFHYPYFIVFCSPALYFFFFFFINLNDFLVEYTIMLLLRECRRFWRFPCNGCLLRRKIKFNRTPTGNNHQLLAIESKIGKNSKLVLDTCATKF